MDSRTLNLAVDDILQLTSAAQRSRSPVNTRRYAHYFSPAPSLTHGYTDADSAWEFMAPSPLTQLSPHTSTSTCNTQYSTAAQQIVARYRAAEAGVEFVERKLVDDVDRQASIDSETASVGDPSVLDDSYTLPSPAVKVRYRQSRCEGQSQARLEALAVMKGSNLGESDAIVCQRPGCRDVLKDVNALTFHLHIHNLHDRASVCPDCGAQFESGRELSLHRCHRHIKSPPMSPLRDSFRRVISTIACCHADAVFAP